jgi:hypothetical protein
MSLPSRLEALAAQCPGLDRAALAARVSAHADDEAVAAALDHLVADGRLQAEGGGYRLADRRAPGPEQGGRTGPDPTRFGDWEAKGICIDF